jgi:hypothetical protein
MKFDQSLLEKEVLLTWGRQGNFGMDASKEPEGN